MVASAPFEGAETITNGAPPSRCIAALSRSVKMPVDSITKSTPKAPHGNAFGSRSVSTFKIFPSTLIPPSTASIVCGNTPRTESYFKRCAIVLREPRSLTATISISAPRAAIARKKLRPIRPNPFIPTRTVTMWPFRQESSSPSGPNRIQHLSSPPPREGCPLKFRRVRG